MVFYPSEFLPEYRPVRKFPLYSTNGWWLNPWPFMGWLETFVKIAAWLFVPFVLLKPIKSAPPESISPSFAVQTSIMLLAASLLTAAIIDRLVYREIISMIFVFPNNWAHWTVAISMLRHGRSGINIRCFRIFCWLMFAGDIVKLIFFAVHDFTRLNISRYVIYFLTALFAFCYAAVLALDHGYFSHTALQLSNSLSLPHRLASLSAMPNIFQPFNLS